ncbi:hypothetical protein RIF29_18575 [Crotalaria pallida]|uniref:Uncharacterized protein n=1 Tax=Crotalaria pallida TaxID=3830 RepID=A0AAN9FR08_CROPI
MPEDEVDSPKRHLTPLKDQFRMPDNAMIGHKRGSEAWVLPSFQGWNFSVSRTGSKGIEYNHTRLNPSKPRVKNRPRVLDEAGIWSTQTGSNSWPGTGPELTLTAQ